MGLFGIFSTIFSGGILFVDSCKADNNNYNSREAARKTGQLTYIDNKGRHRLVSNKELVVLYKGEIRLAKNNQLIYDYNVEKIKMQNIKSINDAKEKCHKGCEIIYPEFDNRKYFTEFSTGKRYYLNINKFAHPEKYYIGYYTGDHTGISTMLNNWNDDIKEVTLEEYKLYGGYSCCKDGQGIYYEW